MNKIITFLLAISVSWASAQDIPVPNQAQLAWQEAELGVVFHYDLHVFDNEKYVQAVNRVTPVEDYNIFDPQNLDTDQWIKAAKDMGAKFAILTATHETGFALFQSNYNPYSLKAVEWQNGKGDLVKDFVESCRKYGIKPGIYLGIRWNSFYGVHNFQVNGEGEFRDNRQKYYNKMVEGMLTEICTNYGELFEIWFDGGASHPDKGAPDVLPIVKKYQPNALFYHNEQLMEARWGGSESGTVSYPCWATFPYNHSGAGEDMHKNNFKLLKEGDPNGEYYAPAMSDAPLRGANGRHEWFWEPGDEEGIYPLDNLINMYYKSVGRNSTLIMGITPDPTGLVPEPDVQRMKEWGDAISERFSDPLGKINLNNLTINFDIPTKVNQIVLRENILKGERCRKYIIEGRSGGKWVNISEGSCIGNKRIDTFDAVEVSKLRLKIADQVLPVEIKTFQAYYVDLTPVK